MKILIVSHYREIEGGTEGYIHAILLGLPSRGHECALLYEVSNSHNEKQRVDNESTKVIHWPETLGEPAIPNEVRTWCPDIVYLQSIGGHDREKLLLDSYQVVWFAHDYKGTCISGLKRFSLPLFMPCDRVFGVACLALYFPRRCGGCSPISMWKLYKQQRQKQHLFSRYVAVVVASTHMKREYERNGISPDRVFVAPYFPPKSTPDPVAPVKRGILDRIIFVGRMVEEKGCGILIKAVLLASKALRRQLTLIAVGDGEDRQLLQNMANKFGVHSIFTGWVDSQARDKWIRSADIIAVPSVWPEPYGLIGLEAGCLGIPSVAFDVGGICDWLIPGETGEIASGPLLDSSNLANAIIRAIGSESHLHKLRIGAWKFARRHTMVAHLEWLDRLFNKNVIK